MSDLAHHLNFKSLPRCPECNSIAIASRLMFSQLEGQEDGFFTYTGKVCKSREHTWNPEED